MVRLQRGAALALRDDNGGIQNLVELGEVEEPAPERETLVPKPTNVRRIRSAELAEMDELVLGSPRIGSRVVVCRVTKPSRPMHLAERVDYVYYAVRVVSAGEGVFHGPDHGDKRDCRVQGEEDIVEDDERVERTRLADGPWLVAAPAIVRVEEGHCCRVDGRYRERDVR